MAGNPTFLKAEPTLAWLGQFAPEDQPDAAELLGRMRLVTRDAFAERLMALILSRMDEGAGPVGLYAEREVPSRDGVPHKLFKEANKAPRRAYGVGPVPIRPVLPWKPAVGSEGIVAQLISEICKSSDGHFYDHPGPGLIRKHSIRRFMLVTDFIGSGDRVLKYLRAAWRVRSVRSWWSSRSTKGLNFEVVAYTATSLGREKVSLHPCSPLVSLVAECTSIIDMPPDRARRMRDLCRKYNPGKNDPLGYGGVGALVAFAHGVPNNAPSILYEASGNWAPLFKRRVTATTRETFVTDDTEIEAIKARLIDMRHTRLAGSAWLERAPAKAKAWLAVLAALSHPPRNERVVAGKTGLAIIEVRKAMALALANGWITGQNRLTDSGSAELDKARGPLPVAQRPLPGDAEIQYYPTSLRVPTCFSS